MKPDTKKLLIVEDEAMIRHALVEAFASEEDLAVLAAHDGKEGLASALNEHPDYILTDILMPVMNGLEMIEGIRNDAWGKEAKIMVLSNLDDNDKKAEARAHGVYDFYVKSNFDAKDIVKKVRSKIFGEDPGVSQQTAL